MNKLFLTPVITLILICINSSSLHAQWQGYDPHTNTWEPGSSNQFAQNNTPDNSMLTGWQMKQTPTFRALNMFFLDSLYGWACFNGSPAGVVKTTDGGETWDSTIIIAAPFQLNSVYFVNEDTGWTAGNSIFKTTNGGSNWKNLNPSIGSIFYTVHFTNSNTGFLGGIFGTTRGLLTKTTNGGETWDSVFVSTYPHSSIRSQFWFDSDTGWFGGGNCLLKTTDGGNTFIDYTQYLPTSGNNSYGVLDINFVNTLTGWISGNDNDGNNIHKTTDGGYTWVYQDNPASQFFLSQVNAISFVNESTGWGGTVLGMLLKTTDGGSNWFVDLTYPTEFWSFSYIKDKRLWCGADFGEAWYLDYDKIVGISSNHEIIPDQFKLHQNYPNPFNPITNITFEIPQAEMVTLSVYDALGRTVATLVNERLNVGSYNYQWTVINDQLSSGVYFYQLRVGDIFSETKKMMVVR